MTFAVLNVFGRTLKRNTHGGRDHNGNAHAMMMFGPQVRGSVIGGIASDGHDFSSTAINSVTGASAPEGDIQPLALLESAAKTLATAVGQSSDVINHRTENGKVITATLL